MRMRNFIILAIASILAASCAQPVPNPIIGAYTMPDRSNPTRDNAALALKNDGTFIYVELISGSTEYQVRIDGTYAVSVDSYDFVSASGLITFTVPDDQIPDRISDLLLKTGGNSFLFDWSCDRNSGPQDLTLVVDPEDSAKNYEFEYIGSSNKLDREEDILPDWMLPDDDEDGSGEEGEDQEPNPDDPEDTDPTDPETPPVENPEEPDGGDTEENPEVPDSGEGEDTEVPDEGTGTDTPEEEPAE